MLFVFSFLSLNFYLFYNDYERSYTTYINHASCHRCLRSDGLLVTDLSVCFSLFCIMHSGLVIYAIGKLQIKGSSP